MSQQSVQILLPSGVILTSAQCTSVTQTQTYNYSYVEDGRLVCVTMQVESKELSLSGGVPLGPQASNVGHLRLPHNGGCNSTSIYSTPSNLMSHPSTHSHPSRMFTPNPVPPHSRSSRPIQIFGGPINGVNRVNQGSFTNTQQPATGSTGNAIQMCYPARPHATNPSHMMPNPGVIGQMGQAGVHDVRQRDTPNYLRGMYASNFTEPQHQMLDKLLADANCIGMGQAVSREVTHGTSTTGVAGESKTHDVGHDDESEGGLGAESNSSPEGSEPAWSDLDDMAGVCATPPQYHGLGSAK